MASGGLRQADTGVSLGAAPAGMHDVPLALYVHIPWCVRKCPYCDFNSHTQRGPLQQDRYVDALLADLASEVDYGPPLPEIQSIFIGGGTPSLFEGVAIERLLGGIAVLAPLAEGVEITLEANPGTAEAARFAAYRAAGVTRLSLGVQSLDDAKLAALGRIHTADQALAAYELARAAGFHDINLDLMFGLPQQPLSAALDDLDRAIELDPEHISWYQLTLEPNTLFYRRPPPALPDHDRLADMMQAGQARLAAAGYRRYEISAYARPGHRARHNYNYWTFGDYLGIGAGAHGKRSLPRAGIRRTVKQRHPAAYLTDPMLHTERWVAAGELPLEFFLNTLRLIEGVPLESFARRTGVPLVEIAGPLYRARRRGLLHDDPTRLRATELGLRFLDDLLALFDGD